MIYKNEFNRQVDNLIKKGYPQIAGMSIEEFKKILTPLEESLANVSLHEESKEGYIPFVIVIKNELVPTEKATSLLDFHGKEGIISLYPVTPADFKPIGSVEIPNGNVYILIDIDRGAETLNIAPDEALKIIESQNRSPLTIDEGIAILTHYPEFLKKNNCFSLLASRGTDKRVPALWISENRPKLGWCWEGNPHTWLGSASCRDRR